jgi:hypothetical protein
LSAWSSPRRLPFALDPTADLAAFVALSEAQYREASFLDDRILPLTGAPQWTAWSEVEGAAEGLTGGCDFIFHVGHVGSTLLARLLGRSERVFCLREPAILRALARLDDEALRARCAPPIVRLLGRVWRPGERALVKATSFVGEIAPALAVAAGDARAILMFAAPQIYIAGILAGEASRREMNILAAARLARLDRRAGGGWSIGDLGEGERAAMSWACEFMALAEFAARAARPVLWIDFDSFLVDPGRGLARALVHLHGEAPAAAIEAILSGDELSRYAKAPEHPFDAHLRRRVIAQAQTEHREEIERGLAWLNALGAAWPPFATAARYAAAAARTP